MQQSLPFKGKLITAFEFILILNAYISDFIVKQKILTSEIKFIKKTFRCSSDFDSNKSEKFFIFRQYHYIELRLAIILAYFKIGNSKDFYELL